MAAICLGCAVAPASAQTILTRALVQARRLCDGDTITAVDIRTHPPSYTGVVAATQRITSRWLALPHVPTRPAVIAAYMRLSSGTICTEIDRSESERLLRAQPFIASATIQAIRESAGHVRLQVDVVDELRLIGGATTRRGSISSLLLGTENFSGRGVSFVANVRRGFEYRDGFGVHAIKYGMFGRPDFLAVRAERRPVIGERLSLELAEPFLTDLQRRAFHLSTSLLSGYTALLRPTGEAVSLFARRTAYDVGWVTRVGRTGGRGPVGLVGAVLLGEDVRTGRDLVIVSDTGLITQPANPFGAAYPAFTTTRLAAVGGLRALRFITAHGFDALTAEQDMGVGVQVDLLAGPSLQASARAADLFIAGDFYAGFGDTASFFVVRALAEARRDRMTQQWNGVVASGRLAWYGKPSSERTHKVNIELSEVRQLAFPMQLTFRDPDGGLPGFGNSPSAGGQRLIAHVEERHLLGTFGTRADVAVGIFATAGKLWAGDVPYGRTTPVRAAAGVTLLGAYPAGGKRTYRVDLAVPINPERGGARVELRFGSTDRTRLLWLEPNDVARARTGAVPVSLMKW
jgi:hypothetical protein